MVHGFPDGKIEIFGIERCHYLGKVCDINQRPFSESVRF